MLIEWKDSYATGVADVDYEHRELIELINALHAGLKGDQGSDEVAAFFGELLKAVSSHFALEESVMRKARYARFEPHKNDHEDLIDQLRDMMDDYDASPESHTSEHLGAALDAWFSNHFKTHDSLLHGELGH